jgi:hypothetical protein
MRLFFLVSVALIILTSTITFLFVLFKSQGKKEGHTIYHFKDINYNATLRISANHTIRYSKFRCFGDDNDADEYESRACVFFNLCYHVPTKQFHFFRRNKRAIIYDKKRWHINDFTYDGHGFVLLTSHDKFSFAPVIIEGALPTEDVVTLGNVHVLYRHTNVSTRNIGRYLWEDLAPIFTTYYRLGLRGEIKVIDVLGTNNIFTNTESLECGISESPFQDMDRYISSQQKSYVCFEKLQAGVGNAYGVFHRDHNPSETNFEVILKSFRDRILACNGLDPEHIPKAHHIIITKKEMNNYYERYINNTADVASWIKEKYPNVKLDIVDWDRLSIHDQLKLMTETTLLIAPIGGISSFAPFLPRGAHAIFMDFTGSADQHFFDRWPHFKRSYYEIAKGDEFVEKGNKFVPKRSMKVLDLDRAQIMDLVDDAMEDMV